MNLCVCVCVCERERERQYQSNFEFISREKVESIGVIASFTVCETQDKFSFRKRLQNVKGKETMAYLQTKIKSTDYNICFILRKFASFTFLSSK